MLVVVLRVMLVQTETRELQGLLVLVQRLAVMVALATRVQMAQPAIQELQVLELHQGIRVVLATQVQTEMLARHIAEHDRTPSVTMRWRTAPGPEGSGKRGLC